MRNLPRKYPHSVSLLAKVRDHGDRVEMSFSQNLQRVASNIGPSGRPFLNAGRWIPCVFAALLLCLTSTAISTAAQMRPISVQRPQLSFHINSVSNDTPADKISYGQADIGSDELFGRRPDAHIPTDFHSESVTEDRVQRFGRHNEWREPLARQRGDKAKDPDKNKKDDIDGDSDQFNWTGAMAQSFIFLGIQHSFRLTQSRTQRELGGPFFKDWGRSVRHLRGWDDGDSAFINYIAHPLQGGVTGRIFVNNSKIARNAKFGSSDYWESRLKAFVWSAAWSTQFELGPFSEASIGNVGLHMKHGKSPMAFVDLVITPTTGTAVVVLEDTVDNYILKNWIERKFRSDSFFVKAFRILLTPTTAFSNILRGKPPWKRNDR